MRIPVPPTFGEICISTLTIVRSRKPYHDRVDRERMILDAAAVVFYEKGFHGVGVDELGKRAGLSGTTLYRYFSSQEEILAALFNEAMDELVSATAMVHDDPQADLARLIRHHVGYAVSQRQLVTVYQREDRSLTGPWKRHFHHRRKRYVPRWEAIVAPCAPGAGPDQVAALTQSILGLIFSIADWPPPTAGLTGLAGVLVGFTAGRLARPGRAHRRLHRRRVVRLHFGQTVENFGLMILDFLPAGRCGPARKGGWRWRSRRCTTGMPTLTSPGSTRPDCGGRRRSPNWSASRPRTGRTRGSLPTGPSRSPIASCGDGPSGWRWGW